MDNDFYKITLEFTRDFIDNNYDEWIENNNKEEIKISRWEMMIYFKKLENVSQNTIDYYLLDAESKLIFNDSYCTHVNCRSEIKQETEICKNPSFIKLILLSKDEKRKSLKYLENYINDIFAQVNHFEYTNYYCKSSQILTLRNKLKGDCFINGIISETIKDYLSKCGLSYIIESISKTSSVLEIILISIVNKHYKKVLDNVEGYVIYCKTKKLKVDFRKIGKFTNFIKEHVESTYGFKIDLIYFF